MRPQVADRHLKRIASDSDHWRNWLELLAELRRGSEGDAAQLDRTPKAPELRTSGTHPALN
jgi:hypothetical protein